MIKHLLNYGIGAFAIYLMYNLFKIVLCDVKKVLKQLSDSISKLSENVEKQSILIEQLIKNK